MIDIEKFMIKAKPFFLRLKKNSRFFSRNLLVNLRRNKISRNKLKRLIGALDESRVTKKWVRGILITVLCLMIVNKIAENYDETKTLKDNGKDFIKYLEKLKKKKGKVINGC